MSIDAIRQRISVINAETARLNTQRNQNIGKRETLQKQLSDAFALYEKNYGVKLTVETLQSELNSVTKKKEEELSKIEQILNLINAGDIAGANNLAGVVDTTHTAQEIKQSTSDDLGVQSTVATPEQTVVSPQGIYTGIQEPSKDVNMLYQHPTSPTPVTASAVEMPVVPSQIVSPVVPPSPSTSVVPPVVDTPVVPPQVASPVSEPKPPVLTGVESLDMGMSALEGFTKPTLGSVAPPPTVAQPSAPKTQVQDFGAILNGTAFKPQ